MTAAALPRLPDGSLAKIRPDGKRSYKQADEARFRADCDAWREQLTTWEQADMAARCAAKAPPRPKCWPTSAVAGLVLERVRELVRTDDVRWSYYAKGAPAAKGKPAMPGRVLEVVAASGEVLYLGDPAGAAEVLGVQAPAKVAKPRKVAKVAPAEVPAPVQVDDAPEVPTVELDDIAHPSHQHAAVASLEGGTLLAEYLGRLLHEPKRAYAQALADHLAGRGPAPEVPAADWAPKVAAKVRRYTRAA